MFSHDKAIIAEQKRDIERQHREILDLKNRLAKLAISYDRVQGLRDELSEELEIVKGELD